MRRSKKSTIIPGAITHEDILNFNSILDSLWKENNSIIFQLPVDYINEGLYDYLTIVKKPMDLSTVKLNIKSNKYISSQEIINDIMLIWKNCKQYNIEGSDIYKCADYMEKVSKRQIERYYKVKFQKTTKFSFLKDYEDEDFLPPKQENEQISFEEKVFISNSLKKCNQNDINTFVQYLIKEKSDAFQSIDLRQYKISVNQLNRSDLIKLREILSERKGYNLIEGLNEKQSKNEFLNKKIIFNTISNTSCLVEMNSNNEQIN